MCFEIKIKIHEEADLYNPLDPEGSELSDEVITYMVRKYQEKGRKEKHIIHIISDEPVAVCFKQNRESSCRDPVDHRVFCPLGGCGYLDR